MAPKALSSVSMERFAHLKGTLDRVMKQKENIKKHTEAIVEHGVRTAEIGAFSYAMGAAEGYFGEISPFGIPAELGVAVGAHALAIIMPDSKAAPHLRNVGDAGMGVFGYKMGAAAGKKFGKKADEQRKDEKKPVDALPGATGVAGELERGSTGRLTDEAKAELEKIAAGG